MNFPLNQGKKAKERENPLPESTLGVTRTRDPLLRKQVL